MFVRMLKLPDEVRARYDISTLKGAIHAAAPCPIDVKQKMIDWWGPILIEYYAGSEGNGVTVSWSKDWLTHRGTVGRAVVGKLKILDDDGKELPAGRDRHHLLRRRPGVRLSQRSGEDASAPSTSTAGRRSATSAMSTTTAFSISPTARPT